MSEITQADIDKAIQECYWRKEVADVSICAGHCVPCVKAIVSGKCEAVRKLVNELAEAERGKNK